ncbi:MAG: hypothetical protein JWN86_3843 [Planctomycetota bacterium]|nr:hypothetical protein [Planctomycetota bacterium]
MPEADIPPEWHSRPIRDLGLTIPGSRLEPIVDEFLREVRASGLGRIAPTLYLSSEWGVPDGTTAIAIPFYLATEELASFHARKTGHLEGRGPADILRYLRHEMGHVVNYAYRLYASPEWEGLFGPISLPYREDYRPEPFSLAFVRHLPGWYAQKHPDEDWSETFAVWMTPGLDWRAEYAGWPAAMAKLEYCDRIVRSLADCEPLVISDELDEDVTEIGYSLDAYYASLADLGEPLPAGLDTALRAIFEDHNLAADGSLPSVPRKHASALIASIARDVAGEVFRWTGHFPERTLPLLHHLAERADAIDQVYPETQESSAIVGLTALVTTLALNFVRTGKYFA